MEQVKNIQFTELIKAGGRLREFNFRKSKGINNDIFTVDVASETGERYYIIFRLVKDIWVLENKKMISWIEEVLPVIQELIQHQGK